MRNIIYILMLALAYMAIAGHKYEDSYLPIKSHINSSKNDKLFFDEYVAECSIYSKTPYFNICIAPYYKELLKTNSTYEVLKLAENDVNMHSNLMSDCHFIGHEIGSASYHKDNGSILQSIKDCGDIWLCGGGCHHQIFIEYMDNKSSDDLLEARDMFCAGNESALPADFEYTCHHSFGHSIALYFEFELDKARNFCSNLTAEYEYECLDGIYHQNYFRYLSMEFDEILKRPSLLCNGNLSGIELKACYERAGKFALTYYGYHNNQSFPQGLELCSKFKFEHKARCLNGLFTFTDNCDKTKYDCNYLFYKTKFLNWIYDILIGF